MTASAPVRLPAGWTVVVGGAAPPEALRLAVPATPGESPGLHEGGLQFAGIHQIVWQAPVRAVQPGHGPETATSSALHWGLPNKAQAVVPPLELPPVPGANPPVPAAKPPVSGTKPPVSGTKPPVPGRPPVEDCEAAPPEFAPATFPAPPMEGTPPLILRRAVNASA